jgi:lipopolysaccharide/colanic/teichoic acid biosynthesis glycosyltransferase
MAFARPSALHFHDRAGMVKRVGDMILTPVLLVLLAVPLVLFALLIRLESPVPRWSASDASGSTARVS